MAPPAPEMTALAVFLIFAVMVAIGAPLFLCIGLASALCLKFLGDYPLEMIPQQTFGAANDFAMVAIPFFILSSAVMTRGGCARRIVNFCRAIVAWMPGGLGVTTVFAAMFFAALSGSSPATLIAVGGMMYPGLIQAKYPERFAMGLTTTAGSLGILIPPSIPLIIYGILANAPIDDLFIAGIAPGLLVGLLLGAFSVRIGLKTGAQRDKFSFRQVAAAFKDGFFALMLPVIILGGIYGGLYTVTEASAIAVVYALFVELVIYREIRLRDLPSLFAGAAATIGMIMIIVAVMLSFKWYLTIEMVPEAIADAILPLVKTKMGFLLAVNVFLLILGCLMDVYSALLVALPILLPMTLQLGVDPIHFGIIFIVNLEIGFLTPPIGLNLFTSSALFKKPILEVVRSVLPFLAIMFVVLALVTYLPALSLTLVNAAHALSGGL